jgi:transglutaminase-like putative cysteine protease
VTALLLAVLVAQAPAEPQPFLHAFALKSALAGPIDWTRVALLASPREGQRGTPAFISRRKLKATEGVFRVTRLDQTAAADPVLPRHRRASWVIDFDEPAFTPAWEAALAQLGPKPEPRAVVAFASGYLTRKSYDRGFDVASYVATHRQGDCTEHAVFLAALLRRFGIPARGMVGLALVPTEGEPQAFGHMWVEAHVDGRWRVLDAAIPESFGVGYAAGGELVNEGPGYVMGLVTALNSLEFSRLELVAAP